MNASSGVKSSGDSSSGSDLQASVTEQVQQQAQQHQQYLGDATQALPDLDPIQVTSDDDPMPDGVSQVSIMYDCANKAFDFLPLFRSEVHKLGYVRRF